MRSPFVRYMVDAVLVAKLCEDGMTTSRRAAMARDRLIGLFHQLTPKQQKIVVHINNELNCCIDKAQL